MILARYCIVILSSCTFSYPGGRQNVKSCERGFNLSPSSIKPSEAKIPSIRRYQLLYNYFQFSYVYLETAKKVTPSQICHAINCSIKNSIQKASIPFPF